METHLTSVTLWLLCSGTVPLVVFLLTTRAIDCGSFGIVGFHKVSQSFTQWFTLTEVCTLADPPSGLESGRQVHVARTPRRALAGSRCSGLNRTGDSSIVDVPCRTFPGLSVWTQASAPLLPHGCKLFILILCRTAVLLTKTVVESK